VEDEWVTPIEEEEEDESWGTWEGKQEHEEEEHGPDEGEDRGWYIGRLLQDFGGHNSASSRGAVEPQHR